MTPRRARPAYLEPKATRLPEGHDDSLDAPPATDPGRRSARPIDWPRINTARGGTDPPDGPLAPPPTDPARRTVTPFEWLREIPTPPRLAPIIRRGPGVRTGILVRGIDDDPQLVERYAEIMRGTREDEVLGDLDPDIALWPTIQVQRWPFTGPPPVGIWPKGWLGVDNTATVWVCVEGGQPATWETLGTAESINPFGYFWQCHPGDDLQAVWDAAPPGMTLVLAPGVYSYDPPLRLDHSGGISGAINSWDPPAILVPDGDGDCIQITSDDVYLSGLSIEPATQLSTGAAISAPGASGAQLRRLDVENITTNNLIWQALNLQYLNTCRFGHFNMRPQATDYGLYALHCIGTRFEHPVLEAGSNAQTTFYFEEFNGLLQTAVQNGPAGTSMYIKGGDDVGLEGVQLNSSQQHGLLIDGVGDMAIYNPFTGTMAQDGAGYYGLYITNEETGTTPGNIRVIGGQISGVGGAVGLNNTGPVHFTGTMVVGSSEGNGITAMGSSSHVAYIGGFISQCAGVAISDSSDGPNLWEPASAHNNAGGVMDWTGPAPAGKNGTVFRNIAYLNPIGNLANPPPNVPSEPAYVDAELRNPYPFDCVVYVQGMDNVYVDNIATGMTEGAFHLPAHMTIHAAAGADPVWHWYGL